jgi:hypothetical protein
LVKGIKTSQIPISKSCPFNSSIMGLRSDAVIDEVKHTTQS